ncbi:MAG: hypothetical protein E7603_04010 [Ruminococcaceae bacterium]|nr:hypothetical protein [Oscillospiraceae bacterium]
MINFFYDSYLIFLRFLIPGIFLGMIYDVFRLIRIGRNSKTIPLPEAIKNRYFPNKIKRNKKTLKKHTYPNFLVFIEDISFFLIVSVTEILATYHLNNGEIRIYCLLFSVIGFFCYQKTISLCVIFISKKMAKLFQKILFICICLVLDPIVFFIKKLKRMLSSKYTENIPDQKDKEKIL